jgi:hypothetical protein
VTGPRYRNNIFQHVLRGGPAGGGYTTVEDLLVFDVALRSGKLVSKAMLERMWRAYPERNSPTYGYGFWIFETPASRAVGHSGGFPGISADFTTRCWALTGSISTRWRCSTGSLRRRSECLGRFSNC